MLETYRQLIGVRHGSEALRRGAYHEVPASTSRVWGFVRQAPGQDVLVAIARNVVWLVEPRLFRPWAFRIASRASFKHLRRQRRRGIEENADSVLASLPAPEAPLDNERLTELLESDALSPASRAVLVLHFQEEMQLDEVAAVLEIPLGTVKSRLAYGLRTLRRYLAEKRS